MSGSGGGVLLSVFVAALLLVAGEGSTRALASVPSAGESPEPSASFDLSGSPSAGVVGPGQPVHLSIRLSAVQPSEDQSLVAIIEGAPFVRRLVPLRFDAQDQAFHATVELEPVSREVASGRNKAVRVRATFAWMKEMTLEEFLVRSVYLTVGLTPVDPALSTAPHSSTPPPLSEGFSAAQGHTASPLADRGGEAFTEQNLIPSPVPARAQAYWRDVSERLGQRWRQPAGRATESPQANAVVGVRFRLHASGDAQLIQIERSSGVAELDEAGLQAVLHAHPFPPFPEDVSDDAVDMHVEFGPGRGPSRLPPSQNSSSIVQ